MESAEEYIFQSLQCDDDMRRKDDARYVVTRVMLPVLIPSTLFPSCFPLNALLALAFFVHF